MKNPHNKKVFDQELSGEMLVFYAKQLVGTDYPVIGEAFKKMNKDFIGIKLEGSKLYIKELFKRDIEPKLRQIDH